MNHVKRILATAIIGGMLPLTAVQAAGVYTHSQTKATSNMLSNGYHGLASFLEHVELTHKSAQGAGAGFTVTASTIILGQDTAATIVHSSSDTAPTVTITASGYTGTFIKSGDTITFTGTAAGGAIDAWTCALVIASAGLEFSGAVKAEVIRAAFSQAEGPYVDCR